jgi:AcrR family transcriptional regulator
VKKGDARRQAILETLADHVLAHGLQDTSLRSLGPAAGTSGRMLLHYFADKDELLTETLALLTRRLIALAEAAQPDPLPFNRLVPQLVGIFKDPRIQPHVRLWPELVGLAAQEQEPFRSSARQILTTVQSWIAAALQVEQEAERAQLAALALTLIVGCATFDTLGEEATLADALAGLTRISDA